MTARPLEAEGQAFIHGREAFRAYPYDDKDGQTIARVGGEWRRPDGSLCRGYPTIGWGQRIWGPKYYGPCTREIADQWFQETAADHCAAVDRNCPGANKYERGALVSFSYNCGTGGLVKSGITALHTRYQTGEIDADELEKVWVTTYVKSNGEYVEGLRIRRAREVAFYLTPVPSTPGMIEFTPEEAMARAYDLARSIAGKYV